MDGYENTQQTGEWHGAGGTASAVLGRAAVWISRLRVAIVRRLPAQVPFAVKLALSISVLISVGMALLGAVIVHNQTRLLNQQMHTFGGTVVAQMANSAKEPILAKDTLLLNVLAANLAADENVIGTVIYSADRAVLARAGRTPFEPGAPYAGHSRPFLDGKPQSLEWTWRRSAGNELDAISFVSPVRFRDMVVGYTLISFGRGLMTRSVADSIRSIVVATVLMIILGIAMSYVLGRRLSRPLHDLMNASRAMSNGQYHYRIQERRNDEIGYLMGAFNSMAQGLLQKAQVEDAFSRYVPSDVARKVLANLEEIELGGKQVHASVMFVDIVGFTARSETMSPEGVADLLNEFYTNISHAAAMYKGTVDKYMGDCAMVVFGISEDDPHHAFHCVACAVFFQRLAERMNALRLAQNKFPVHFRIGLNTGPMLAGNMGTRDRVQFTVVGDSVNLASRLCAVSTADEIIIDEHMYDRPDVRGHVVATRHQAIRIRGKTLPVSTYLVHDLAARYQADMAQALDGALLPGKGPL